MLRKLLLYLSFLWIGGYLSPIIHVNPIASYLIAFAIILLLLFVGLQKETQKLNVTYIVMYAVGIGISMIMAMIYHDQSLLSTAISQRPIYFLACFFVWWKIGLSEEELFPMLRVLSILTLVLFAISLFYPEYFLSEETIEEYKNKALTTTDVLCFIPGFVYVLLYAFWLFQIIPDNFSGKDWGLLMAILAMFFIYQNRSTLIYLSIFFIYFLFKQRSSFGSNGRWLMILTFAALLLFMSPQIKRIVTSLWSETQEQIDDEDYNRRVALQFYLFDYNQGSVVKYIFGNGQPASDTEYLLDMVEGNEKGAYWSDLGFIGDWFLFGIIPIIAILVMMYQVFRYSYPIYLKYLFASYLIMPTIHTFSGNNMHVFYFSLVMYLVCLNEYRLKYQEEMQIAEVPDAENRIVQNA